MSLLCVQIGGNYVVDCTQEEELCSNCHLSLAIDRDGNVLSTVMEGEGALPYTKMGDIVAVRQQCSS